MSATVSPVKGDALRTELALAVSVWPLLTFITGLSAGAAFAVREHRIRLAAERFVAAALESILRAIDANDPETGAHLRRVAEYATILAEEAGLDGGARHRVERVALFHDIGKIDAALLDIVNEHHSLSAEEMQEIREHPRRGAEVLAALAPFYPELCEGVLAHHEWWNGNGYPRGLRAEAIPVEARLVALADTFDAITNNRSYRRGRSAEIAARAIADGRGTQFDPEFVDLMLLTPVFDRITEAMRRSRRPRARGRERRSGAPEHDVPNIIFRWRSEVMPRRVLRRQRQRSH